MEIYTTSIPSIFMSPSTGRSFLFTLTFSMACTTSYPLLTRPKTVCLLSSQGHGTVVMKNCEPLVLGPLFAMETVKGRSCLRVLTNSSSNSPPQIDSPPFHLQGIACLYHKRLYDTMEYNVVIIMFASMSYEIFNCSRTL